MIAFLAAGSWLLFEVNAATPTVSAEAEQGTISGCASKITDQSASNGAAVSFNSNCNSSLAPTEHINLTPLVVHQPLSLGTAYYDFKDFTSNTDFGVDLPSSAIITGAGIDRSILEMVPNTSTKAGIVPTATGTTNQLSLIRSTGSPKLSNFTLKGTSQGHLYNGLRLSRTTNAQVSNVKVAGIPGNNSSPPGETFGINDYSTTGSVYKNIEIDGSGIGASGFATNSTKNVSIQDAYLHDSGYAHGAAFWQTDDITITNVKSVNNKSVGFNFERTTGTVTMRNITVGNNGTADLRMDSDQASAVFNIYDPVYLGAKLRIKVGAIYRGVANVQKKSDIHVYVNGVDQTNNIVQWL